MTSSALVSALRRSLFPLVTLSFFTSLAAADTPAVETAPVPIVSTDKAVQENLQSLNQFLDSHPKFDETLQANLDKAIEPSFREKNPAWNDLLKTQPGTIDALKTEQRFLLHRAIVRMAHAPVLKKEIVAFDKFLDEHADVLGALEKKPRLIVDSDFLVSHPALADYFGKHPALSSALLENAGKRKPAGNPADK